MNLKITRDGEYQDFFDTNKKIGYQWRGKAFGFDDAGYAQPLGDADTIQEAKDLIVKYYKELPKRCTNTGDLFGEHF